MDPDGRFFWENKNIQEARREASFIEGATVRLVDGKYGKDAQIVSADGQVLSTKPATVTNQGGFFSNLIRTADEGGRAHAGNTGTSDYNTKEDYSAAVTAIGVIIAVGTLGSSVPAEAGFGAFLKSNWATIAGLLSTTDDALGESNESFAQSLFDSNLYKGSISGIKALISIINISKDFKTLQKNIDNSSNEALKAFLTTDAGVNFLNTLKEAYDIYQRAMQETEEK